MSTRILFPALAFFLFINNAFSQITIEQCQEKARANYPLVNQYGLIEKSREFNLSNAAKAWLPQVSLNAKATWQSEVIELPFTMPGIGEMDQDQYQATIEISQTLWDGGATHARKEMYEASAEIDKQKYEVDLYAIRERVNQLYFGILFLKACFI
ncbi:MAG TPA: TolC family protein [Bacteroidales bacterium]|nr:TolC family protein [Bacteroidales bacterium]